MRRNILTEGLRLNELVGKTFTIGAITVKGIRLCEPCSHLADTVNELLFPNLIGLGRTEGTNYFIGTICAGEGIKVEM